MPSIAASWLKPLGMAKAFRGPAAMSVATSLSQTAGGKYACMAETRAMATRKAQAKVEAKASTKGKYAWLAQVEHVEGLAEAMPSKPTKELKLVEAQTGPLMYEGRPCSGLNVYQVEDVRVKDQLHRNDAGCMGPSLWEETHRQ